MIADFYQLRINEIVYQGALPRCESGAGRGAGNPEWKEVRRREWRREKNKRCEAYATVKV
jgi:hypothetical protein